MTSGRPHGPTDMTDRDPLLAPFDALIGTWSTEAEHRLMDEVVSGSATFEWLQGGHFVVLCSHHDHDLLPTPSASSAAPSRARGSSSSTSTRAACAAPMASRSRTASC